jgi:hypothetical protein
VHPKYCRVVALKRFAIATIVSGIWINASEFLRNEVFLKQVWLDGFREIGLSFPSEPVNAAVWVTWSFIFAFALVWLTPRMGVLKSALAAWTLGFVLLWLAMWNMGILPRGLLAWAVPWSLAEVTVAAYIAGLLHGRLVGPAGETGP